jgi:hypothetical protein
MEVVLILRSIRKHRTANYTQKSTLAVITVCSVAKPVVIVSVTVSVVNASLTATCVNTVAAMRVSVLVTNDMGRGTTFEQYARAGEYVDNIAAALTTELSSQSTIGMSSPCPATRNEYVLVKRKRRVEANMAHDFMIISARRL